MQEDNVDDKSSFVVRPGTVNTGQKYESLMVAYLSLVITIDTTVNDFVISSNDEKFGNFDDIVLESESAEMKYALQLKYNKAGKIMESNSLTGSKRDFSIMKYFDDYRKMDDFIRPFKLILFTNRPSNITNKKILKLHNRNISIQIIEDKLAHLGTGICYRFKIAPNEEDTEEMKQLETFLKQLYLCTNQANYKELEKIILEKFQEIFCCEDSVSGEKYINFISDWYIEDNATKKKLDRKFLEEILTICLLTPNIKPLSFVVHEENDKHLLMKTAISTFNVTMVDEKYFYQVERLWSSCQNLLENDVKIMSINKQYHLTKLDVLNNKIKSIILWIMDKCPLIVKESNSTYKAIHLSPKKTFIILMDTSNLKKEQYLSCFYNLAHLREETKLYEDFLKTFQCSLEGKATISLQVLFQQSEEFNTLVTTSELLQMLDDSFIIGKKEILPEPHIKRHLKKNIIQYEFLNSIQENTNIVISCDGNYDKIKKYLINIEHINMKKFKSSIVNCVEKYFKNVGPSKIAIYLYEERCSREIFEELCSLMLNKDKCHHFRVTTSGLLEWMYSKGDISDLRDYKCTSNNHCSYMEEHELVDYETYNDINIVTADPGMGKSVLLKSMNNHYSPNYWTLLINTKEHSSYFEKKMCDSNNFMDYIIDKTQKQHLSKFEFEILSVLKRNRRVTFLWDGLDEISDDELNVVMKIIDNLSKRGFKQWITSRHLQNKLEQIFKVFSIILRPFDDIEQKIYIEKRLSGVGGDLKDMVSNIQNYVDLEENNTIFGIPLQMWMLTELFIRDIAKYQELLKHIFSISDLYQHFINQKFSVFFEQRVEISPTNRFNKNLLQNMMKILPLRHEQLALRATFDDNSLNELNIHPSILSEEEQVEVVDIGIITDFKEDGKPTFAHLSYAEYLAAVFLHKCISTKQEEFINKLKRVIFQQKYRNIRFMFDLLIAENRPAHLAVLHKNFGSLKNCSRFQIHSKDEGGRTPLHLICSWGQQYSLLETEQEQNVFTINGDISINLEEESPTFIEMLQFLLENGCDPADKDELFQLDVKNYADRSLCLRPILYLLHKKFDVDFNNFDNFKDTCSVLVYSAYLNCDVLLDVIRAPLIFTKQNKLSLLHIAAASGSMKYTEKLLKIKEYKLMITWRSENGFTPVYVATLGGHKKIVELLIEAYEDNDFESCELSLPSHIHDEWSKSKTINMLDIATTDGFTPIHAACETGCYEIAKLLAENHVNLHSASKEGVTPIHLACRSGNQNVVELLTKFKVDLNACTTDGDTPLLLAVAEGHSNIVKLLISSGTDLNIGNKMGITPFFMACYNGYHDLAKLLIEFKADINITAKNGFTPLHVICQEGFTEIAQLLTKFHVNVNTVDAEGCTPLHIASCYGYTDIAETLIKSGANIDVVNKYGVTPLYMACQQGRYKVAQLLISYLDGINESATCHGNSPIFSACEEGHLEIVKLLLRNGANVNTVDDESGNHLIHIACRNGYFEIVKFLVECKSKINIFNKESFTPVMMACINGHYEIVKLLADSGADLSLAYKHGTSLLHLSYEHPEVIKLLIKRNVDVNSIDEYGVAPLHCASDKGTLETVKILIESNAKLDIMNRDGETPFYMACRHDHKEVVKHLIESGASLSTSNKEGVFPIHTACLNAHHEIVKLLIEANCDLNVTEKNGFTPINVTCAIGHYEIVKLLIESNADLEITDINGYGPIHTACGNGHCDILKLLIQSNVNKNAVSRDGLTPLHLALYTSQTEAAKILIEANADLRIPDAMGFMPIHIACDKGYYEIVELLIGFKGNIHVPDRHDGSLPLYSPNSKEHLLIQSNNDVNFTTPEGYTAIHIACHGGHFQIVKLLIESGANINHCHNRGNSPIHIASADGYHHILELLINHEGIVNTIDEDGGTPLHDACCNGHLEAAQILVQHGAHTHIRNKDGSTPLDLAIENGHSDIVEFLLQHSTGTSQ